MPGGNTSPQPALWVTTMKYAERIVMTNFHRTAIKKAFAEGLTMLQMHDSIGITYAQCQSMVIKMRRTGELPPVKRRAPPDPQKVAERKARKGGNKWGNNHNPGFFKLVSKATPPINAPLIAKINKEKPGPNAKPFLECSGCMWPVGDNLYCGEPKDGGRQPYCAEHRKRGTSPWQPSKKAVENRGYALLKSINE